MTAREVGRTFDRTVAQFRRDMESRNNKKMPISKALFDYFSGKSSPESLLRILDNYELEEIDNSINEQEQ
jgi:hypothetical protein